MSTNKTIELDCPPGMVRPWDLIDGITEGTGFPSRKDQVGACFGYASYSYPEVSDEEWMKHNSLIAERIEHLYNTGTIRAGSW